MQVLFVCTANRERSRTAEIYFSVKYSLHRFRSAGINQYLSERHGGVHLKKYMCDCADLIICMENCHSKYILEKIDSKYKDKIRILELGDFENYMSIEMINVLNEKVEKIINQFF